MSRPIGPRALERLAEDLSGRDRAILWQVDELRLMTARQIEAVHFSDEAHASEVSGARICRRVLERLVRDRLLVRLERRVGGVRAGSASFIYAIGPVGQRILGGDEPRKRLREPSLGFTRHTLAISQLVVDIIGEARRGRVELLGLQAEPTCWRRYPGASSVPVVLRPDLHVVLGVGDYEHRWFVEIDLGSEHLPTLLRKCAQYEQYYRSGSEQDVHGVFPRVLWVMHAEARAERLRQAIERDHRLTTALFTVITTADAVDTLTGAPS